MEGLAMAARRSMLPGVLMVVVPLAVIAAGIWLVFKAYRNEQRLLDGELRALPAFNSVAVREQAAQTAAARLGIRLPPPPVTATPDAIRRKIAGQLQAVSRKYFPPKALTDAVVAVSRKYTPVKPGQQVSVQTRTDRATITGKFKGRTTSDHSVFIQIDQHKIRLADVVEEYHYLFDAALAERLAAKEVAKAKDAFMNRRKALLQKLDNALSDKYFRAAGYLPEAGGWRPARDLHAALTDQLYREEEQRFARNRTDEINQILSRHKLFGMRQVQPTVPLPTHPTAGK